RSMIAVIDSIDTTEAVHYIHTTDSIISGTIAGDTAGLDLPEIMDIGAIITLQDTAGEPEQWGNWAVINSDGSYQIHVSSLYGPYTLHAEFNGDYYDDFVLSPYWYGSVEAGQNDVDFSLFEIGGTISGKVTFDIPSDAYESGVMAYDSATGLEFGSNIDFSDSTYSVIVPNGVYTVIAGYKTPTDSNAIKIDSIIIADNDKIINFTPAGPEIVPLVIAPDNTRLSFDFACFPNPFRGSANLHFASPVKGKCSVVLYDMSGRIVGRIFSGNVAAGKYMIHISRNIAKKQLQSGTYIARLRINGKRSFSKNLKLLKVD
ncbi:MAG: T9SS type A sorting domain-containing protein, partial [Chitinivibrionales bacterium]|nr:T9SS type A sorting domain-containing protein [Chitinivibrionales bacterium]